MKRIGESEERKRNEKQSRGSVEVVRADERASIENCQDVGEDERKHRISGINAHCGCDWMSFLGRRARKPVKLKRLGSTSPLPDARALCLPMKNYSSSLYRKKGSSKVAGEVALTCNHANRVSFEMFGPRDATFENFYRNSRARTGTEWNVARTHFRANATKDFCAAAGKFSTECSARISRIVRR